MELNIGENKNNVKSLPCMDTPEWLRSFKGCEHYSDEEAMAVLNSLDTLATILLGNASQNIHHIDNQCVVYLHPQEKQQKIAA